MQPETQNQAVTKLEIEPQAESPPIKKGPGGKRPGAGRKPNLSKILLKGVSRNTILAAVENVDVGSIIIGLLKSKREQVRLETLHFIFDRVIGKPQQDLSLTGGIVHAHTRDPLLASLPKEALDALLHAYDEVLSKHVPVITPDAPQITLESKRLPDGSQSLLNPAENSV